MTVVTTATGTDNRPSFARTLIRLFADPVAAFQHLRRNPTAAAPIVFTCLATLLVSFCYSRVVDISWLAETLIGNDPRLGAMTAEQRGAAMAMMNRNSVLASSAVSALIGIPLLRFVEAGYYRLAAKFIDLKVDFRTCLSLSAWSALPNLLALPLMLLAIATHANGQLTPDQLQLTSINALFVHSASGARWGGLLSNVTLLQIWCWALSALAIRLWSGRGWIFSIAFTCVPLASALAACVGYILFTS